MISTIKIPQSYKYISYDNVLYSYIRRISDCAYCWSSSSCSNIIWLNCSSRRASKSSSIWPESGLKRRSPGSKKHMLIRSTTVKIWTRRDHFWTSSVLVEQHHQKILYWDLRRWNEMQGQLEAELIFKIRFDFQTYLYITL